MLEENNEFGEHLLTDALKMVVDERLIDRENKGAAIKEELSEQWRMGGWTGSS